MSSHILAQANDRRGRCRARTVQLCTWRLRESQSFYFTFPPPAETKPLEPSTRGASPSQLCSFFAPKIRWGLRNPYLGKKQFPTHKTMSGADFVCLLPLHLAAGIGDRCTRRRIVEQDGDIFTSSFEHKMPPFKCRGTVRCWGATCGGSSHKSAKTHSTRVGLVKEEINEIFLD